MLEGEITGQVFPDSCGKNDPVGCLLSSMAHGKSREGGSKLKPAQGDQETGMEQKKAEQAV